MVCVRVCACMRVYGCVCISQYLQFIPFFLNFIIAYYGYYPSFAIYLIVEMVLYI